MPDVSLINANAFQIPIKSESVHCIVTSIPYWGLRKYEGGFSLIWGGDPDCSHQWDQVEIKDEGYTGRKRWQHSDKTMSRKDNPEMWETTTGRHGDYCSLCGAWYGELGLEPTLEQFLENIVLVFREVKRVLRQDGTLWLNVGDLYASSPAGNKGDRRIGNGGQIFENKPFSTVVGDLKPKDMVGLPWAVAFALRADGWWLRSAITWCKKSPMPESVTDRPTKATEKLFLLAKSSRYFFDAYAVRGLSKSLNLGDSINENLVVPQLSSPSSFAAESRDISSYYKFAPYFVLACFLTTKRIPVKQRYDYFSQIFNMFKSPMTDGSTILSGFHVPQLTAELIVNVLQNWEIIISKLDLQAESKFWIEFRSALAEAIVSIKTSLSIKESSEIVSKLIANIQILRQTIPLDALLEGLGRDSIGIDLSFDYLKNQARKRLSLDQLDHWIKGISKSGNGSKPEHKNKQIDRPGSSTQGMHAKRTEAGSVVLPMFEDL